MNFFSVGLILLPMVSLAQADTRVILPEDLAISSSVASTQSSSIRWTTLGLGVQAASSGQISIPSRNGTPSVFQSPSIPYSQLQLRFTGFEALGAMDGRAELDFGIGVVSYSRNGTSTFMNGGESFTQLLTMIPFQLGYRKALIGRLGQSGWTTFIRGALTGQMAVSPRSVFSAGQTLWGYGAQASLGLERRVSNWGLSAEPFASVGRLSASGLRSFGIQAGLLIYL
ncbi:MAG: hypothetical protein JNL01_09705 [Bdellovibrionales bacterium]|nr:hypothetical protein [Bdellovibrionales bacterium]